MRARTPTCLSVSSNTFFLWSRWVSAASTSEIFLLVSTLTPSWLSAKRLMLSSRRFVSSASLSAALLLWNCVHLS